jgi:hypothetical protein
MPPLTASNVAPIESIQALTAGGLGAQPEVALTVDVASGKPRIFRWLWIAGTFALAALLLVVVWLVMYEHPYTAGDAIGYNLGLAGGIAMLILLTYPLRKRVRLMSDWGGMANWFRYHMALGIGGPVLIMFHSTFRIGSMNARVALYSMLLVFASGIIGRFVYRHIHSGLYGRRLTLAETESERQRSIEEMGTLMGWVTEIGTRLTAFQEFAMRDLPGAGARTWRFITLRFRGRIARAAMFQLASVALEEAAREQHWGPATLVHYRRQAGEKLDTYVNAVCSAAQFSVWERLFSLWHVAHVPFVYLLFVCGVVHVVAVHMY